MIVAYSVKKYKTWKYTMGVKCRDRLWNVL